MRMDGMKKRDHSKEWLALLMALLLMLCCFSGLAEADAALRTAGNLLENAEINRLIDENYQQGWRTAMQNCASRFTCTA